MSGKATHGGSHWPEYVVWQGMRRRCEDPRVHAYKYYGGRGIQVCERWRTSFSDFISDMGRRPSPKLEIDRIHNDGNYEPGNCRWATSKEQTRNMRRNRILRFRGKSMVASDWAALKGIRLITLLARLRLGWSTSRALTQPVNSNHHILNFNGESMPIAQWARVLGLKEATIHSRIHGHGWSVERALSTPPGGRKQAAA